MAKVLSSGALLSFFQTKAHANLCKYEVSMYIPYYTTYVQRCVIVIASRFTKMTKKRIRIKVRYFHDKKLI